MVYGPRGAPGWPVSTPWFLKFFFAVIVTIATTLVPIGWPNIDNVTCLLTPSVALPGSQYQETDKPLQGGRRCWKIPHCHHHNHFTSHRLYCPPRRRRRKRKTLALYLPMAKFLSRSHENWLRYISYHAVLPSTQLQEVPLGSTPSPDSPSYRLDCPSRQRRRKRPHWGVLCVNGPIYSRGRSTTFPLMVSSTNTKITKTMKFLYHIYIGTSSQTN
jgi:hypothetical protein